MHRAIVLTALAAVLMTSLWGCKPGGSDGSSSSASNPVEPTRLVTDSGVEMVSIPGGQFVMGSADGNTNEAPPHTVTVSGFLMDKVPVTHEMFVKVELPDPSCWQAPPANGPVERVRWRDAKQYCNERSRLEKLRPCYDEKKIEWDCDYSADGYRLPTEAEWEYAARAGTQTPYACPPERLGQYAWFADNAQGKTHVVGSKKPNAWGLCDMSGNVSQWCEDVYSDTYYKQSAATDPTGPPSPGKDVKRVMRGGNWNASADACRVTYRQGQRTGNTDACFSTNYCGFRCVRRATAEQLAKLKKAP